MKLIIDMRKRSTRKHDNCSDLVNFPFLLFSFIYILIQTFARNFQFFTDNI